MRRPYAGFVLATLMMALAGNPTIGAQRFEDAVGDVLGDAPDIIAVTVEAWEDPPLLSVSVEYGAERPFGTDMETYTDVVFVGMATVPTVDDRGIIEGDTAFLTGTHGVTMAMQAEVGAHLVTPAGVLEEAVGLEILGNVLTFTVDRALLDDPQDLYIQVLSGVEREPETGAEEGDTYPELDQPPVHVDLRPATS